MKLLLLKHYAIQIKLKSKMIRILIYLSLELEKRKKEKVLIMESVIQMEMVITRVVDYYKIRDRSIFTLRSINFCVWE